MSLLLVSCTTQTKNIEDDSYSCNDNPFIGIQVESPFIPLSFYITPEGVTYDLRSPEIDLLVFRVRAYMPLGTHDNPRSTCLRVRVIDPDWEGGENSFLFNFRNHSNFKVRIKTEDFTDFFVYADGQLVAKDPNGSEFVRYDPNTSTLIIDATGSRVSEFQIIQDNGENIVREPTCYERCYDELGTGVGLKQAIASLQDFVNSTRDYLQVHFKQSIVPFEILMILLSVGLFAISIKKFIEKKVFWGFAFGAVAILWFYFWIYLGMTPKICW
jgi:hypothetical protein